MNILRVKFFFFFFEVSGAGILALGVYHCFSFISLSTNCPSLNFVLNNVMQKVLVELDFLIR